MAAGTRRGASRLTASRARPALLAAAAAALAVAGCGDSGSDASGSTAAPAAASTAAAPTTTAASAGGGSLPRQTAPGAPLATTVGGTVKVVLPNNPSTGYTWQFLTLPDPTVVKTGEPQDLSLPDAPPGAAGVRVYPFRGLAAGTTTFTVGYVPPSGNKPNVTRRYTIRVR